MTPAEEYAGALARIEQDLKAAAKDLAELVWRNMGEKHDSPRVWKASCEAMDALRSLRAAIAEGRAT